MPKMTDFESKTIRHLLGQISSVRKRSRMKTAAEKSSALETLASILQKAQIEKRIKVRGLPVEKGDGAKLSHEGLVSVLKEAAGFAAVKAPAMPKPLGLPKAPAAASAPSVGSPYPKSSPVGNTGKSAEEEAALVLLKNALRMPVSPSTGRPMALAVAKRTVMKNTLPPTAGRPFAVKPRDSMPRQSLKSPEHAETVRQFSFGMGNADKEPHYI